MQPFRYVRPTTLPQALAALSPTSRPKAGGFDLLDLAKRGVSSPEALVDLSKIRFDGRGMEDLNAAGDHGETVLGARVTLARISESPEVAKLCPAVGEAAREAATPQVRNAATLGGNLLQRPRCAYFRDPYFTDCRKHGGSSCPARDGVHDEMAIFGNSLCCATHPSNLATVLVALRAEGLVVAGVEADGKPKWRAVQFEDGFFLPPEKDMTREANLGPAEILWDVTVPHAPHSAYVEINHKQSYDWAQASCCVSLDGFGGKIRSARVVLGAVAPVPLRVPEAEALLVGPADSVPWEKACDAAAAGATPLANNRHKVALVRAVVRRAIFAALARRGPTLTKDTR